MKIESFEYQWCRIAASMRQANKGRSLSIELFARTDRNRWVECLRFDCFDCASHYHVFPCHGNDQEQEFGDEETIAEAAGQALDILESRGLQMMQSAGYAEAVAHCAQGDWSAFIRSCREDVLSMEDAADDQPVG